MARNVSDEELQLKKRARRRLVGAVVLVTVVAVVLPMILDSEPKPATQSINIQIPSPDAGVLSAKPVPLKPAEVPPAKPEVKAEIKSEPAVEDKPAAKTAPKVEAKPAPKAEAKPAAKAESKPKPVVQAKPAAKPEVKAAVQDKPKAAAETFVIQVVALADAERAKALQQKIVAGGMKAYTEVVQAASGPVTRVRIGPYASREAAEKARQQLQGMKLDGKVVTVQ